MAKKKISFRLPFSFLSTGIKEYTFEELMRAHDAIYEYDFHLKNGGDEQMIELFYAKFFEKQW